MYRQAHHQRLSLSRSWGRYRGEKIQSLPAKVFRRYWEWEIETLVAMSVMLGRLKERLRTAGEIIRIVTEYTLSGVQVTESPFLPTDRKRKCHVTSTSHVEGRGVCGRNTG